MTRRTLTLALVLTLSTALWAQPQKAIKAMDQAIARFLQSKDMLTKDTHWSQKQNEHYFKFTVATDTLPTPKPLVDLERVFTQSAAHATATYFYSPAAVHAPIRGVELRRDDSYFGGITGTYSVDDGSHFRLLNFNEDGQGLTCYGLKWREVAFTDREGRPYRTIDGMLFKFYGGIWQIDKFLQGEPWHTASQTVTLPTSQDDGLRYETLLNQVKYLQGLYTTNHQNGNEQSCDAVVYFLHKLCKDYSGTLTQQQFETVMHLVAQTFMNDSISGERRQLAARALSSLRSKAEMIPMGKHITTNNYTGDFVSPDNERLLIETYDYGAPERPRVTVRLSGRSTDGPVQVACRHPKGEHIYSVTRGEGDAFTFTGIFDRDQLLEVTDAVGHRLLLFADSIPTEVRLQEGTLTGSPLNNRFAQCQQRLSALLPERHRYACIDEASRWTTAWTVMDTEGYNRLMAEAHALQLQLVEENQDNLIPAYYLAECYPTMTLEEMQRLMRRDRPWADHIAMQPVWQHYEDLQKRQAGRLFTDATCWDAQGEPHRLSEYIGKGDYVVLHFWNTWSLTTRRPQRIIKYLHKTYKDKNLQVVSIALDHNRDSWARYVEKRDLKFTHLIAANGQGTTINWSAEAIEAYGIHSLPESIVLGPDGRIIATGLNAEQLKAAIAQLPLTARDAQ